MFIGGTNLSYVWRLHRVVYEPVIENVEGRYVICKGEVVHVCVSCADVPCGHGETPTGLPSTAWARLGVVFMALVFSPLHPGPFFPTLFARHSPVHGPLVQQLSQRTLWYSQVPAV